MGPTQRVLPGPIKLDRLNVERPRVNPTGGPRNLPATKPHKLSLDRQEQLRRLAATGEPVSELAAAFGVGRATAYRYLAAAE